VGSEDKVVIVITSSAWDDRMVNQQPQPKLKTSMAGPLGGAGGKVRQRSPPKLKMLMAGPLGGAGGKVRQRPPPKLKTRMVRPLGVLAARSDSGHHQS
jgi:hypothetical protein